MPPCQNRHDGDLIQIKARHRVPQQDVPSQVTRDHDKAGDDAGMERELLVADQFKRLLTIQTEMCAELEKIADALPGPLDGHACLELAQRMLPMIKRAHEFEECKVWPLLSSRFFRVGDLKETLERLNFEHWGDEDFAEQVFHQLREYVRVPDKTKADGLAWTLRGFFQNMQRHIAFEREHILPLIAAESAT